MRTTLKPISLPDKAGPRRRPWSLRDLRVWQKLALITVAFTLPMIVLLGLLVSSQQQALSTAAREARASEVVVSLYELMTQLAQHRRMVHSTRMGMGSAQALQNKSLEVNASLGRAIQASKQYGSEWAIEAQLLGLQQGWQKLQQDLPSLSTAQAFSEHSRLIQKYISPLIANLADQSGLGLGQQRDSYYLVDITVNLMPGLLEDLAMLRHMGFNALTARQQSPQARAETAALIGSLQAKLSKLEQGWQYAIRANPSLQKSLGGAINTALAQSNQAIQLAQEKVVTASTLDFAAMDYSSQLDQALDSLYAVAKEGPQALRQLLTQQSTLKQQQLWLTLGILSVVVMLLFALAYRVTRQITQPLSELSRASEKLAAGNFDLELGVVSGDELGSLTQTLQKAAQELKTLVAKQEAERQKGDELQANVSQFLGVANEIAQGDLTKRGQVTEDALGNVVDAINLMAEEIGYLLKDVSQVAQTVNSSAAELDELSTLVVDRAQSQAIIAQKANQETTDVTHSIHQMSQSSHTSAEAARQTLEASNQGQAALSDTLAGMQNVRREVQSIAKNIKTLSDRSLEVSQIVDTIGKIAKQTNLLALNAAIEAAGAGEAGARFAVVADQVRKLADDSARAASQVGGLVKQIQGEVQGMVVSIEGGTKEVEQGYHIASEASQRLKQIATLASQSAQLAEFMSSATQQQVQRVDQVSGLVQNISNSAAESQAQSQRGRQAAERLRNLAQELTQNLSRFRLPE